MIIKTKLFEIVNKNEPDGNKEINNWLKDNSNIKVVSTNSFSNEAGWGYIIMYKTNGEKDEQNDLA